MKIVCLLLVLALCSFSAANVITEPFCYWSGTAPICRGSCETGEFVAATNAYGDGKTCSSGVKKYCCKMPLQWIAQIAPFFAHLDNHYNH